MRNSRLIVFAAASLLAAAAPVICAAQNRVTSFETGEAGTASHEDFSFRVHADGRREIIYAYGKDRKEVILKSLGVKDNDGFAQLRLGFPNGLVLELVVRGQELRTSDDAGTYSKTFRWAYEGPVDGRGTFCAPCVEEADAIPFLKSHYFR